MRHAVQQSRPGPVSQAIPGIAVGRVDCGLCETLNSLVWYAGLYAVSAAALRLAAFGFSLLLAKLLSVDDYAGWGLLYALQTGLATFCLAGVMESVVGLLRMHRSTEGQQRLFGAANDTFLVEAAASV